MEINEKPKLEEAGAFWIKTSKTGTQFLTGKVKSKSGEEISIIVFKNKYKTEGSNQPDYRIYFDNGPKNNNETTLIKKAVSEVQPKTEAKAETKSEEIPF
jgi:uncharacterized protein (DUF736 family)